MNSSSTEEEDYLDQLSRILPSWHRSFTSYERFVIIFFVSIFVSIVGCILLCLICSHSALRRRHYLKKKLDKEQRILIGTTPKTDTFAYTPPPPRYESIVRAKDINTLQKSRYLDSVRKSSYGTGSEDEIAQSNGIDHYPSLTNGKAFRSQSTRSSLSNGNTLSTSTNTYLFAPYAQINAEFNIDITKNILIVHLTNGEHIPMHPAFDEHAEFFIHLQLLNNKILKKFYDSSKKRRSSLPWNTWKKLQEKSTKKLSRISNDDTLLCDETVQFEFHKDDITTTSIRFLLFCIDRTGIQDLISEALIRFTPSMISNFQQIIQFKDLPQITFGEIFLGISYLPTAERLTIKLNKLRYFCKIENDQKIDARLIITFFHHGRRFSQQKLSPISFDQSTTTTDTNVFEINETIIQNVPQNDIQSIYIHFELIIHILHLKDESIISCGSILLGQQTRYRIDWQKILEQPRQIHLGWYQFFG